MSNPVLKIIQEAFATEISNDHQVTPHAIIVKLPDNTQVIIGVILTSPCIHAIAPYPVRTNVKHTYHYLHQQTKNNTVQYSPFNLQSIEDCRSYVDDVCKTFVNAKFYDFEITFPDGSAYLVVIAHNKNHKK